MPISEKDFQKSVIDLARVLGYKAAHFRGVRVQRKDGSVYYQTPVQADGAGFPDLVLTHKEKKRTLFIELKSEKGIVSPEQLAWLETLAANEGVEVYTLRPSEYEYIEEILMLPATPSVNNEKLRRASK
jgi:hypothetical protein